MQDVSLARVKDGEQPKLAQMHLAARLCGHCCCFKELTNPVSLERGIGPDCLGHRVNFICTCASELVDWLAWITGMPHDFVVEVGREALL